MTDRVYALLRLSDAVCERAKLLHPVGQDMQRIVERVLVAIIRIGASDVALLIPISTL
jgi:hypothetical protein